MQPHYTVTLTTGVTLCWSYSGVYAQQIAQALSNTPDYRERFVNVNHIDGPNTARVYTFCNGLEKWNRFNGDRS